ncbi:MAG: class I SAM-dependent methyltransferase [Thermoleophilaceae bacterium]
MIRARGVALGAGLALVGAAVWWRRNPSACPYGQRFWVEAPHPFITRARLAEALAPRPGERLLEVGPGTGYYTLGVAEAVGADGRLDIVDVQQEMLDHTTRAAREAGLGNLTPHLSDARSLPFGDGEFDGAYLVTVLGEVPDQDAALRELRRVLKPGARLVVGELFGDPHMVTEGSLRRRAEATDFRYERRFGPAFGYFARLLAV